MKGNITELPKGKNGRKRWRLRAYAGRDPITLEKRYVSEIVWGGRREAESRLAQLVTEVNQGERRGTAITVGELLDRWLEHRRLDPGLAERTLDMDAAEIERVKQAAPGLANARLDKLRGRDIDLYYAKLGRMGKSANTIRGAHRVLSTAMKQAVKWELLNRAPSANATPPSAPKTAVVAPTLEEVRALLNEVGNRNHDLGVFLWLSVTTSARRGEICALRWEDIDTVDRSMVVRRHVVRSKEGYKEVEGMKSGEAHRIALDDITLAVLAEHRLRMEERAKAGEHELSPKAHVFSRSIDGRTFIKPHDLTNTVTHARDRLGLPHLHLHTLRHFGATQLLPLGVDIKTISGRLHHASAKITLDTYAHFLAVPDREAADMIGKLLGAPVALPEGDEEDGPEEIAS